jgi:integrative and conjugative element protein (TIGR02256 family)
VQDLFAHPLTFVTAAGRRVEIQPAALAVFRRHQQLERNVAEAGGVLLGRILGGGDLVVDEACAPSPADRRSRFGFTRAREPAQRAIDSAWNASAGHHNYLGEWHTHPEPDPTPSSHDRREWMQAVDSHRYEQAVLLFLIVGTSTLRLWVGARGLGLSPCFPADR